MDPKKTGPQLSNVRLMAGPGVLTILTYIGDGLPSVLLLRFHYVHSYTNGVPVKFPRSVLALLYVGS